MEKRKREIDFVYFDLGCVLITIDKKPVARGLAPFSEFSYKEIMDIFFYGYEDYSTRFWAVVLSFDKGKIYPYQFYAEVKKILKLKKITFERFIEIWQRLLGVDEKMVLVVEELRERGIRTGIISDLCVVHHNKMIEMLDQDLFDIRFFSFLERYIKREAGGIVFDRALRAANVPAEKILFIDDREPNIEQAKKRGMRTFLFNDNLGKLLLYLEKAGVKL